MKYLIRFFIKLIIRCFREIIISKSSNENFIKVDFILFDFILFNSIRFNYNNVSH